MKLDKNMKIGDKVKIRGIDELVTISEIEIGPATIDWIQVDGWEGMFHGGAIEYYIKGNEKNNEIADAVTIDNNALWDDYVKCFNVLEILLQRDLSKVSRLDVTNSQLNITNKDNGFNELTFTVSYRIEDE
jgi:hypothetical protein